MKSSEEKVAQRVSDEWMSMLLKGRFGIEKESMRMDENGNLAQTDHPDLNVSNISMDFSESQVEFISDVHDSIHSAGAQICILEDMVEDAIYQRPTGKEFVWTYSNPPHYDENNIRIAFFEDERSNKTNYREYLAGKYGKVKMLYSGLHLNFSLPLSFFELMHPGVAECQEEMNDWYLKLTDRLMSDSWLIVMLTSASPVGDPEFLDGLGVEETDRERFTSFRNSKYGYWNFFYPNLDYRDYSSYLKSIQSYIDSGDIESIQELYYPIRLKPYKENTMDNLEQLGVSHIELRMLDLNPMVCAGVEKRDLVFLHLLIGYRIWEMWNKTDSRMLYKSDSERIHIHQMSADRDFFEQNTRYYEYAVQLLSDMKKFYSEYKKDHFTSMPPDYDAEIVLDFELNKIVHKDRRYAEILIKRYQDGYFETRMKETKGERI
ncbi:MAG: hypothetical protein ACK5ML_04715 [Lachnospiraceae bacterium]